MKKRKRKKSRAARLAKAGAAAMARATQGRARVFANKKREQDRGACRGQIETEN